MLSIDCWVLICHHFRYVTLHMLSGHLVSCCVGRSDKRHSVVIIYKLGYQVFCIFIGDL